MAGITAQGWVNKTLPEIKLELEAAFRGVFGNSIALHPESVFGQLIGIFADRLADAWQAAGGVYNASFRNGAGGVALDNIGALIGSARLPATYTYVTVNLQVDGGVEFLPGTVVLSVAGVGTKFTNDVTFGDPFGTPGDVDLWTVRFRAVDTGPKTAPAGTLTVIDTPLPGIVSATNPLDQYQLGTNIETDSAYRFRQESELAGLGTVSARAIRANVLQVASVSDVFVFENDTDSTDPSGVPPHSVEVVAEGGADGSIAQAIYNSKPVGIGTHGTTTSAATDASGNSKVVKFSRPTLLNAWVTIENVKVDSTKFPTNGIDQIKAAVVSYGDAYIRTGNPLIASKLVDLVFNVPGVLDVPGLPKIGTAASPTLSTTIVPTNRQRVDLDTSRTVVTVAP